MNRQRQEGPGEDEGSRSQGGENFLLKMIVPPNPKDSFPARLHQMLTEIDLLASKDTSMDKLRSIVSWLDHGSSFKIHKKKEFENVVMPGTYSKKGKHMNYCLITAHLVPCVPPSSLVQQVKVQQFPEATESLWIC